MLTKFSLSLGMVGEYAHATRRLQYGLIGYPLGHSASQLLFEQRVQQTGRAAQYALYECQDPTNFPEFFRRHPNLLGANVTHPHKQRVIPYLDDLHPKAVQIGAVNLIHKAQGRWVGYNTDYTACMEMFPRWTSFLVRGVVILGTGGAARAVGGALQDMGVRYRYVSRHHAPSAVSYDALHRDPTPLIHCGMVVQATPLGTHPAVASCPPIPYEVLNRTQCAYDLVYNPVETLFLKRAKAQGCLVKNGYEMLERQFQHSWQRWFNPRI